MKSITGCYRTTPTLAMQIESDLEPPWLRLQTKVLTSITRMQTLSTKHPIHHYLTEALRTRTAKISHRSALENILQQFPLMTEKIEHIEPFIRPPWWTLKAQVIISQDKQSAKAHHDQIQGTNHYIGPQAIYTDGSGINNKIGAAACTTEQTLHQDLGPNEQFNVFTGEISAIGLATDIASQIHNHQHFHIYTDSQAAIKAIMNPGKQSGQAIIKTTLNKIDHLTNRTHLTIHWIPGHQQIKGNEQADAEAKKAAQNPNLSRKYPHSPLKSSRTMTIKQLAKTQWKHILETDKHKSKHLRQILKHRQAKAGQKYYKSVKTRKTATTLAQLCTGHCQLNAYLHRFQKTPSAYCECQYERETVSHYMLACRRYKDERKWLRGKVGTHNMRLGALLGDPKLMKYAEEYVERTKRMMTGN